MIIVAEVEQVTADEEEHDEGGDDQGTDSPTAQSESVAHDQAGATSLPKSPASILKHKVEKLLKQVTYLNKSPENPISGSNDTFNLSDFFGSDYLAFLDSTEPSYLPLI